MAAFVTACLYCVYRWEERKKCWLKKGGEIIKITLLLIRFFSFFGGGGREVMSKLSVLFSFPSRMIDT